MKLIILALSLVFADQCAPPKDNCGVVSFDPNSSASMTATLYSEPSFGGNSTTISVDGMYGCTNDIPSYQTRSLLSTASTKVFLHYGLDCAGHVLQEFQGGSDDIQSENACPMSVFIKFNRHGSC